MVLAGKTIMNHNRAYAGGAFMIIAGILRVEDELYAAHNHAAPGGGVGGGLIATFQGGLIELRNAELRNNVVDGTFFPAFTTYDIGKNVVISGDDILVDGTVRDVTWLDAKHRDCHN